MYSSFHCLSFFELVTHYNAPDFFVNRHFFMFPQKNSSKIRKEGQKLPLFFVQLIYIYPSMLYLKYNTLTFPMISPSFPNEKIRKICQFFTLSPPMQQFLPLSGRNVQREYPRKYTDGAYPSPAPDHIHSTSRR